MAHPFLRLLIQEKLADGRLAITPISRVTRPGTGQPCDGCDEIITHAQMAVECAESANQSVRFHVECFDIWNVERQLTRCEPGVRLPTRSAFRTLVPRPSRPWAPRPPAARPNSASR